MTNESTEAIKDVLRRYGNFMSGYSADGDEVDIDEVLGIILSLKIGDRDNDLTIGEPIGIALKAIEDIFSMRTLRENCTCEEWKWGWAATCRTCDARRILSKLKELGYVVLDKDQSLPETDVHIFPIVVKEAYEGAQQQMWDEGWRKVVRDDN